MWIYRQSSGMLLLNDTVVSRGYSGHGEGKNDPSDQALHNIGPIPVGHYAVGSPFTDPHKGTLVMRLTPHSENEMFGRSGFLIHGDSSLEPGEASEGCVILAHDIRALIASSTDRTLEVQA